MTKILLILTFLFMLVLELPKMLVKKQIKDLLVFLGFWSVALLVALLQTWQVKLPSPVQLVTELLKPFIPK